MPSPAMCLPRPATVPGRNACRTSSNSLQLRSSAAFETRFAFLIKGQYTFAPVLGRDHPIVGFDFEHHAARHVHLHAEMDRMLGLPHRNRRVVGNSPPGFEGLIDDSARCTETVDHAPLMGLGRG